MAENSKREQIITADYNLITAVPAVETAQRVMPDYTSLKCYAQTQFPVSAVVGRMPTPLEKFSDRRVNVDQIISELKTDIFVYLQVNSDMDSMISNVADDCWAALYQDQTRDGLCIETTLELNEKVNLWKPFAAFQITAIHKYVHDTGGI